MENYTAWNIRWYEPNEFQSLDTSEQLRHLCALAHLAPSTHNTQPWKFRIQEADNSVVFVLDQQFVLPASDVVGRQSIISLGCALENFIVAASFYGFTCNTQILTPKNLTISPGETGTNRYLPVVRVTVAKSDPQMKLQSLVKSIPERKIIRAEFISNKPLPDTVLQELAAIPDGTATKLHSVTDLVRRLSIAEFQAQADGFVINSPRFSQELGEWLIPNDTTAPRGMPGVGFGLSDAEAVRMHRGLKHEIPLQPDDGLRFALGGKIGLEKSPLIGFITTPSDTVEDWLAAGRTLERIFLTLTSHGIQYAVHAGIVEVALIKKIFSMTLGTLRPITALFRAGYVKNEADARRPHSPRAPLTEVLLNDTV